MLERAQQFALIEASSYLVLIVAMVIKYAGDQPLGVQIMGPVHGVLVLVYAALLLEVRNDLGWDHQRLITAIALGALPLGGFWVERHWLHRPAR
ncbi:MAG: DUF3817 domain-containing protein [Acidimicrobiales bacterium]